MSDIKRLVFSIIQFIGNQLNDASLSADALESLEVAIQCLESAYGIQHGNPDTAASLQVSTPLLNIFSEAVKKELRQSEVIHTSVAPFLKKLRGDWAWQEERGSSCSSRLKIKDEISSEEDEDEEDDGSEDDDDEDDEEDDEDDDEECLRSVNNNNKGDRNGNSVIRKRFGERSMKWPPPPPPPPPQRLDDMASPLDLSVMGKNMVSGDVDSSPNNHLGQQQPIPLVVQHQEQQQHDLVRMPPKGGCVQCGKEGRVTKRGRPHESYFGCSSCQVHLCRKRNCFQEKPSASSKVFPTGDAKREAESLKNEGNNLMKAEKYVEALENYTRAIGLDGNNAIYYCNRAAAHSKLNNHKMAIEDCCVAIQLDPSYSKAYGRMGLAYDSLNQPREAKKCYETAVRLEPQNDGYAQNLRVAEEKLKETNIGPGSGGGGGGGGSGGGQSPFDIGSLLNNPTLMNMATQMMSDPSIQQVMGNLLSGSAAPQAGPSPGFEALLQAGQQLAAQMQASNPDLVEMLRQQMHQSGAGGQQPPDQNNSDNSPNNQGA